MKLAIQPILRTYCKVKQVKKIPRGIRFLYSAGDNSREINSGDIIPVTEALIKDELRRSRVPFVEGYTCFHVDCTFCSCQGRETKDTPDIYINKKTGFFLCENCKIVGSWSTFNGFLKRKDLEAFKRDCVKYNNDLVNWERVTESTVPLRDLSDDAYRSVFRQFKLTICSKETAKELNIRINDKKNLLYFPLYCSDSNIVGYKTYDRQGNTVTLPRIDCPGSLLSNSKSKTVVVVAQINDFLALCSLNLPHQILCLPYGLTNLPQNALPFLEKYKKIILWLGKGGVEGAGNIAKKLNTSRCYVVRARDNQASPVIAVSKKENVLAILEEAKPAWHQFITTYHSLRDEVLAELQNKDMVTGVPWKRFSRLTKIVKGHRRGELTVLTGPTGVGKTTFMSEYSLDLAMQGVNTLWGSFEIRNCRLAKMMLQQFAGGPLEENMKRFDTLSNQFEQLPIFFMTFHGQQPLSLVMEAVEHGSYTYDIAHVIIDNVQFMIDVSSDTYQTDRFWKQDCLIQAFRSFASKNNCHVTLVMHPRKGMDGADLSVNSIFGGGKATQEADNVFIIQSKGLGPFAGKKYLQVCKNRFSGDLGSVPLSFDKNSLSFMETKREKLVPETEKSLEPERETKHFRDDLVLFRHNMMSTEEMDQSYLPESLA